MTRLDDIIANIAVIETHTQSEITEGRLYEYYFQDNADPSWYVKRIGDTIIYYFPIDMSEYKRYTVSNVPHSYWKLILAD